MTSYRPGDLVRDSSRRLRARIVTDDGGPTVVANLAERDADGQLVRWTPAKVVARTALTTPEWRERAARDAAQADRIAQHLVTVARRWWASARPAVLRQSATGPVSITIDLSRMLPDFTVAERQRPAALAQRALELVLRGDAPFWAAHPRAVVTVHVRAEAPAPPPIQPAPTLEPEAAPPRSSRWPAALGGGGPRGRGR